MRRFFLVLLLLVVLVSVVEGRRGGKHRDRGKKKERKEKLERKEKGDEKDRGEDDEPDMVDGLNEGAVFEYGNHEYLSVNHHVSVFEAEEACKQWGGDLASIHSISENNELKDHIRSRYAWIGTTDKDWEGSYKNLDGSAFDFASYARGQPNNYKNEDYTILKDNGAWYDSGPPRRDHPFGPKHGYICKRERIEDNVPEEYSCFENFRYWDVRDCASYDTSGHRYRTITSQRSRSNAEFCTSSYNTTLSRDKHLPVSATYIFRMTLQSMVGFLDSNDRGHIGVAFNIENPEHYDFIYFRVNTPNHCFSIGYRDGGHVQVTETGTCRDIDIGGQDDVVINVIVSGHNVQIKADGIEVVSFTSRFPGRNTAAALTRNGKYYHSNTVGFKNTRVCQAVQCKIEVQGQILDFDYGDTVRTKRCETCTCEKFGQVNCECDEQADIVCEAGEVEVFDKECCKSCIPKPATCLITGDPHYRTFDKIWHHFQGECKYVLVKTADFEVHHGNEVLYGNTAVTWTKEVMVWFKGSEYSLKRGHLFSIDEVQKVVPYRKSFPDGFIVDVKRIGSQTYFKIHKEGSDLMTLKFDGYHRVEIEVAGIYKETTQGLCGTWNSNQQDEYTMRDGSITTDLNEFGNSWKEQDDEFCPDPPPPPHVCDDQPELWDIAKEVCSHLNGTNFSPCHSLVDRDGFYEACLVDVCMCMGDRHCGCASVASYADQCSERGISVQWRSAEFCPLACEAGFQFNHCGSECVATCEDPNPECDPTICVEGCFCPEGKLFFDNECILPEECVCTYEGAIRDIGDVWDNEETCETCTCVTAGSVVCNATICPECPEGHVPVIVDEEECCPVCVSDWLIAVDDKTSFRAKVKESVTFGVEVHLPIELPESSFKWEKRREALGAGAQKYVISDDGTHLTINNLVLQDEGSFRVRVCIDEDTCGSVLFSLSVTNDVIVAVDEHKSVAELSSVTFGVVIHGVDPEPAWQQLMWFHEGVELLPPRSNLVKAGHSRRNLTITSVVKADAGEYQCALTLADGSYHAAKFTLEVTDGDQSAILVAVTTPVEAMHGSNPTLLVRTTVTMSVPPSAFTWMRNGQFIDVQNNEKYSFTNYRKGLQIKGVTDADSGVYTAQMMYGNMHERADVELVVQSASIEIRTENSPLRTVFGQNAHFLVTIDSAKTVPWKNVQWYRINADGVRESQITPPSGRYRTPDYRRKLTIQRVERADEGFYEVEATHMGSVVSARVELIVEDSHWVNSQ